MPDEYDDRTYCVYDSDASTAYGLSAFGLLLISQTVINGVTKCFCFGKGLMGRGSSTTWAVFFFIFSWYQFYHFLPTLSDYFPLKSHASIIDSVLWVLLITE